MTANTTIIPVILSGGTGSRLWPVSRATHPKPFIKLADGETLLRKTFLRACDIQTAGEIITITNQAYLLKSQAEYAGLPSHQPLPITRFLLEPEAKNTAPAIALATLAVKEHFGEDAILLVLPADHLIDDSKAFAHHCQKAVALAEADKIVTFGIKPTYPETGFGYIETHSLIFPYDDCYEVSRFIEKPTLEQAKCYLASPHYLWNAGMFAFKVRTMLAAFAQHAPDILATAQECFSKAKNFCPGISTASTFRQDIFANFRNISIDYAIMEKASQIAVTACSFTWHDVGSWEAYKNLHQTDQSGNTILGQAILIDSGNNLIHSENRMVASIGVNNLAIIDTPDALLITQRERSQEVKHIVETLKASQHESYLNHRTIFRPWGSYTILEEGPAFKIKRIVVQPHAALSLQVHQHRSEHWVVVEGSVLVRNGEREYPLNINESTFVPKGTPHRLSNAESTPAIIIEVQTGDYLGEDDIIRLDDSYGRIKQGDV